MCRFDSEINSNFIKVVIDAEKRQQRIEGWGTALCWWGNMLGKWQDNKKIIEICEKLFHPVKGLGLNIVRYNIGAGENPPNCEYLRVGADMPCFQPEPGIWDWNADAGQRKVLKLAKEKGADTFEAFSNSPPWWMTKNQCTTGASDGSNNLQDNMYGEFAEFLTEVVRHFKEQWGMEFRTLSPINEPTAMWWKSTNNQEGCHFDYDKQRLILKEVSKRLVSKGLTETKISAPEENTIEDTIKSFNSYNEITKNRISQINAHTYSGTNRLGLKSLAAANGKKLWMSEVCCGGSEPHNHNDMSSALEAANRIYSDIKEMEAEAWIYWQAVEDEEVKLNYGLIHANFTENEEYWITKQYYAVGNYSKFIRPGSRQISMTGTDDKNSLVGSAFLGVNNKLVIVFINNADIEQEVSIDIRNIPKNSTISEFIPYVTSASDDLSGKLPVSITENYIVPARSIVTLVGYLSNNDEL